VRKGIASLMPGLELTPQIFTILRALIEARAGLHYPDADRELLADRISEQASEAGFDSLLDYYYFLRYDPMGQSALDTLIEALVIHETYFFRESGPLQVLVEQFISPLVHEGHRPRIWSAACSTGEEPLTLAMMLDDKGLLGEVDLVASDLSRRALEHARRGIYGRRSLRALPTGVAGRWMELKGEQACVNSSLRNAIRWECVNLVDSAAVGALGSFDVILCRNVLIYFSDVTARSVVDALTQALRPLGHLLVGVSESLLRFGTQLACEEHGGAFFYTRRSS
jgi:chemotaxis protein methyltransferase CheR